MGIRNDRENYGWAAQAFHWVSVLIITGMLIAGFIMVGMPNDPAKFKVYGLHKSFGIVLLVLAFLRLIWRLTQIVPALPARMRPLDRFAARTSHAFLYALMFAMPLSGWAMSSASGFKVSFFGLFVLPDLVSPDKGLREFLGEAHEYMAFALIALASLHAGAALLHHFYYKDNVLRSMLPVRNTHAQITDADPR